MFIHIISGTVGLGFVYRSTVAGCCNIQGCCDWLTRYRSASWNLFQHVSTVSTTWTNMSDFDQHERQGNTWKARKRKHHLLSSSAASAGASDLIGVCRSMTVNTSSAMAWSPASPRVVDTPTVVPWRGRRSLLGLIRSHHSTYTQPTWIYLAFCSLLTCVVKMSRFLKTKFGFSGRRDASGKMHQILKRGSTIWWYLVIN